MNTARQIHILCPARAESGGPEALHQLAAALQIRGVDAAIAYYPFAPGGHPVPAAYRHYNVAVRDAAIDAPSAVVVIPEVATALAWRFPLALKAVWWLSVDNYFKWRHLNPGPSVFERRADLIHLCQSCYAHDFLMRQDASPPLMLTDYIDGSAFTARPVMPRLPFVAYNPKKGADVIQRLMAQKSHVMWLPLLGLDKAALAHVLRQVRIYLDFGPHPGRDRIPREAALCGAVVITGRKGAAGFAADIPLPEQDRVDETAPGFAAELMARIDTMMRSDTALLEASARQGPYRAWIAGNRAAFMDEVDALIAAIDRRQPAEDAVRENAG